MKINEITSNRVNEGFWDAVKTGANKVAGAVSGAKTGYTNSVNDRDTATQVTAAQGKIDAEALYNYQSWSKFALTIDPASLSDVGKYKATLDQWLAKRYRNPNFSMPPTAVLKDLSVNSVKQYLTAATKAHMSGSAYPQNQPAQQPAPQQSAAPAQSTVQGVRTGYRIKVTNPANGGIYYKTTAGWFNDVGQQLNKPQSITFLDNLANNSGKEEPDPGQQHPPPPPQGQQPQQTQAQAQAQAQPSNKRRRNSKGRRAP
jgi:hypothetical protein